MIYEILSADFSHCRQFEGSVVQGCHSLAVATFCCVVVLWSVCGSERRGSVEH
jgi:hypothetical protein